MKKARRVPLETSPPLPVVGEDARARYKLQSLIQDYDELMKETAEKRRKLQREKQKIPNLTVEVKFLRQRYQYLSKNPLPTPYKLKAGTRKTPLAVKCKPQKKPPTPTLQTQHNRGLRDPSRSGKSHGKRGEAIRDNSAVLDLNQSMMQSGEEAEFQVEWAPLQMEKPLKQYSSPADEASSDLKLSICRDVRSGTSKRGKRKISWQDKVVVRV